MSVQTRKYDPHKKYKRMGECRRCGRCCDLFCPYLRWIANRDIKAGEIFQDTGIGQPIMAICTANPKPKACADFPPDPWSTPEKCGYYWVEVEE
jgi:Fe-S-cluster containining protein